MSTSRRVRNAALRVSALSGITVVLVSSLVATSTAAARPTRSVAACQLPAMVPGWHNEGFPTDFDIFLQPDGALDAVMLFVDFPDAQIGDADVAWQSPDAYVALHQSGADWLHTASYGFVDIELTAVEQWYRMSQPSTSYGLDRGATFDEHAAYLGEAVALADADVDFSEYDIVYVVVAPNATGIANSPGYIDASDSRVIADGVAIIHGATFGTDVWNWAEPYRHLVLAHETLHVFGLPDLYAFSGDTHRFVGGWDVMADIDGHAPSPFAWHRWKLGWIKDRQVACLSEPGVYTVRLTAVDRRNGTKLAVIPTGPHTALVVESRRATGLDAGACSSGLLVYTVDSSVATGEGPIRVLDGSPGDSGDPRCSDLDIATLGLSTGHTRLTDSSNEITVEVARQFRHADVVTITVSQ